MLDDLVDRNGAEESPSSTVRFVAHVVLIISLIPSAYFSWYVLEFLLPHWGLNISMTLRPGVWVIIAGISTISGLIVSVPSYFVLRKVSDSNTALPALHGIWFSGLPIVLLFAFCILAELMGFTLD